MYENRGTQPVQNMQRRRVNLSWLNVLITGIVLFIVATIVLFLTGNSNLFPTVILIGNFLVPVAFVAFLYDNQHLSALTPEGITKSFCLGGILGVLGASILEAVLIPIPANPNQGLPLTSAFAVGLIEEGCKILAVMFIARHMQKNVPMDGLLLGAAVGMGFAALESTGYAFTVFLTSQGHIGASIAETVIRGVLAPFGHGIWTAILASTIFAASTPTRFRVNGWVLLAYLFVSVLHGLWDGLPNTFLLVVPPGFGIPLTFIVISIIGVIVLTIIYHQDKRRRVQ
jgi:RsiW-degrading membrane proteinase PrsW (M82 family)